ncbi:MAG: leucine-rich repeat protein [Clostridia bacterium]|nr:leucine-rich repeat protein [Clostridia bacterium]
MKKIIKRILISAVIAAMTVTAMPLAGVDFRDIFTVAGAYDIKTYVCDDFEYAIYHNDNNESTAWIFDYHGSEKNLVIPETLDGNIVELINQSCFEDNQTLESVYLPDTLEAIWEAAFRNCKNLKTVRFPETDVALDHSCFYGCESLEEVTINLDYTDEWVWGVGEAVFANSGVKKINLVGEITTFPEGLLDGTLVEEIEMPENITAIHKDAFKYSICETVKIKGVINPKEPSSWADNNTENGQIDKIIYYQPPARSGDSNYYFSRYDSENNYWICEYFVGYEDDEIRYIDDGYFRYGIKENGEALLWEYTGEETELFIPSETCEGNPVVAIFDETFRGNKTLKKVVIPPSVRTIGTDAFRACTALEEIIIPDSVEIIGDEAFIGCTSLKSVDYPPLDYIPIGAFSRCSSLTEFVVPETVKAIGAYAFGSCTSLSCVTLNEGLKQIGYSAFSKARVGANNSEPCITELVLPESLEYIGDYVFRSLPLNEISIPSGVKKIGDYAFSDTDISKVTLNEGLEKIGSNAFSYCGNLEAIDLPDTVNYIGSYAFCDCAKIKSVEIPPLVTEICRGAFLGLDGMKSVTVPSTVKIIGMDAFADCENLTDIVIENGVEEIGDLAFDYCMAKELTIPESVKIIGKEIIGNSLTETVCFNASDISDSSQYRGSPGTNAKSVMGSNLKLKKIVFGENVKNVPSYFCFKAETLEEIVFSDSIERIGPYAFRECTAITSIDLPRSLKSLNGETFYGCRSLTEITIPESLESMYSHDFTGCSKITTINFNAASCEFRNLEATVTDGIYYSPFFALGKLESINLGENIKELPAYLFCGIETIDEIILPSTITDVGVGSFAFSSITSFKASDNLESIEEYAFYGCKNLESADLGNNIMLLGADAFAGCEKLTEIYIPDTVTIIEMDAFKNCSALHTVRMSPNVDYIPREAFYNCKELSTFTWNAESKLVGRLAFGNCIKLTDFDFLNVEKLYVNSFLGSGVNVVQLGETENEASRTPLTTVEVQSFMDCENLATLGIGGNVTTIKTQAFANCENLETAVIADSVTEIADDAFDGCDSLTIYCSEGSYAYSYARAQGIRVSTFVIAPIPNQTYTGFEIRPDVAVSLSGEALDKNIDFGVSYANNINVGNADVTVKGKGDFRMFASKAMFTIVTKNISAATVAPIAEQVYTGSSVTPAVTVTDGIKILREGTDYTVAYSNNTNEGTATAKIMGIGNYSGSISAEFVISKEAEPPQTNLFTRILEFFSGFFRDIVSFIYGIFN